MYRNVWVEVLNIKFDAIDFIYSSKYSVYILIVI